MTKEELKDMIDNTITANGKKEITGEALNLALNAIVEAMSTGSGSGARQLFVAIQEGETLTEEQLASNKAIYDDIAAGKFVDMYLNVTAEGITVMAPLMILQYAEGIINCYLSEYALQITSDGNVSFSSDGSLSTLSLK